MDPLTLPRRAAYLRPITVASWRPDQTDEWAQRAANQGIQAVITKLPAITESFTQSCSRAGLEVIGSFSCFSRQGADPIGPSAPAIDDTGSPLEQIEWYSGLVPGDPTVEDARADSLAAHLGRGLVTAVTLDFLRWPGHWETESRGGAAPRPTSFDPGSLTRFVEWAESNGVDASTIDPDEPQLSAITLLGPLSDEWQAFRTETVTMFAASMAEIAHGYGTQIGAFIIPVPDAERRRHYGQDVRNLASRLDYFVPMTYHSIADKPVTWVRTVALEIATITAKPTLAMIQLTASADYSDGWDWGAPVTSSDISTITKLLDDDTTAGTLAGYCYFPGEVLELTHLNHDQATTSVKGIPT